MASAFEASMGEDDLSRQRRKREARLLDQPVDGFSDLTIADLVADVLAASDEGRAVLDVPTYLAKQGHGWPTIQVVIGYLERHGLHPAAALKGVGDVRSIGDIARLN